MIKFHTHPDLLSQENRKIIFPLLLDIFYLRNMVFHSYFTYTENLKEAHIMIVPLDVGYFFRENKLDVLRGMIQAARAEGKNIWLYSAGDYGKTLDRQILGSNRDDIFMFRFGGFNSKLDGNSFILPAFIQDPYSLIGGEFKPLEKPESPTLGFVGHASTGGIKFLKEVFNFLRVNYWRLKDYSFDRKDFYPSGILRFSYLKRLSRNTRISSDFLFRKRYRAGVRTEEDKKRTSMEFFKNIENNLYTFCIRGGGNFSTRLYETLAMGRIPLLVQTDNRMPFHWLDWSEYCIVTTPKKMEEDLITFHLQHSAVELEEMQEANRQFWLTHLKRENYFIQIHDYLLNRMGI